MLEYISNRSYNIDGLGFLNRILIYIQNRYSRFVMDETSWYVLGRRINKNASKIYIVEPKYVTKYTDAQTGVKLDKVDLSQMELNNAIKYGIINRKTFISNLSVTFVYDIKDTWIFDTDEYSDFVKKSKYGLKISDLLYMMESIHGIRCVELEGSSRIDLDNKTLYISSNDTFEDKLDIIIKMINSIISKAYKGKTTDKIEELCNRITEESIKSIIPKYAVDKARFNIISEIDTSQEDDIKMLLDRISYQYDSIDDIMTLMKPKECILNGTLVKKASEVVDIITAYEQYKKRRDNE